MNDLQSEEKGRKRRQLVEQAINLAMSNDWSQAIETNKRIVDEFSPDPETYNRLGKAYSQLGQISKARTAYADTIKIDPINAIAQRNIDRLAALKDSAKTGGESSRQADPTFFIEETGKTAATVIFTDASKAMLSRVAAGDFLDMRRDGDVMIVTTGRGERLGPFEGKLSSRLIELQEGGNVYSVAAIAVKPAKRELRVLVREMRQSPGLAGRVSFPPETASGFRAYIKGSVIRDERIDDDEDDSGDDLDTSLNEDDDAGSETLDFSDNDDLNEA